MTLSFSLHLTHIAPQLVNNVDNWTGLPTELFFFPFFLSPPLYSPPPPPGGNDVIRIRVCHEYKAAQDEERERKGEGERPG